MTAIGFFEVSQDFLLGEEKRGEGEERRIGMSYSLPFGHWLREEMFEHNSKWREKGISDVLREAHLVLRDRIGGSDATYRFCPERKGGYHFTGHRNDALDRSLTKRNANERAGGNDFRIFVCE